MAVRQSQTATSQGRSGQAERVSGQYLIFECPKGWRQDLPLHRTDNGGTSTGVVIASTHAWQLQSSLVCVCLLFTSGTKWADPRWLVTGVTLVLAGCWHCILPWSFQPQSDIPSVLPPTCWAATRVAQGPPHRAHVGRCLQLLPWDPC